jgi:hypothetical protein
VIDHDNFVVGIRHAAFGPAAAAICFALRVVAASRAAPVIV